MSSTMRIFPYFLFILISGKLCLFGLREPYAWRAFTERVKVRIKSETQALSGGYFRRWAGSCPIAAHAALLFILQPQVSVRDNSGVMSLFPWGYVRILLRLRPFPQGETLVPQGGYGRSPKRKRQFPRQETSGNCKCLNYRFLLFSSRCAWGIRNLSADRRRTSGLYQLHLYAERKAQVIFRFQILVGKGAYHVEVARADFVEQADLLSHKPMFLVDVERDSLP